MNSIMIFFNGGSLDVKAHHFGSGCDSFFREEQLNPAIQARGGARYSLKIVRNGQIPSGFINGILTAKPATSQDPYFDRKGLERCLP